MLHTLKNRNFLLIITGKLISLMGDAIFELAIMWFILQKYGKESGTMLALIMTMAILPKVITGGIAGSIVDRCNKKHVMVLADVTAGITVLAVFLLMRSDSAGMVMLLGAIAILSVSSTMVRIAVSSMIPEMFDAKELYDANSLNQFVERGTALLGYALGGGLTAFIGVTNAVLLNAISFMLCAILESLLKLSSAKAYKSSRTLSEQNTFQKADGKVNAEFEATVGKAAETDITSIAETAGMQGVCRKNSLRCDFIEVIDFLKENTSILHIVLIFTTINFLLDPMLNIVLPYMLKNSFGVTASGLGIVIAALPSGFCAGAVYFSKKPRFLMNKFVLFRSILALNLVSTTLIAAMVILPMKQASAVVACFAACLFVEGIFSAAINIGTSAYLQKNVPDSMRGKFFGISTSLSAGLIPLGSLIAGALIGIMDALYIFIFVTGSVFFILCIIPKRCYGFENILREETGDVA